MEFTTLESIFSYERLNPYVRKHNGNIDKAIDHYKANIKISESFYAVIAILEVGLRNNIDYQLMRKYGTISWFDDPKFIKNVSRYQIDSISDARKMILNSKKVVTPGKMIAELTFAFWTSLFDTRFEKSLWKELRLAFPNCPKRIRQRRTISSKLNSIRKLRNRVFHHEPISWNIIALEDYRDEILECINWLNKDLVSFFSDTIRIHEVLNAQRQIIQY